MANGPAVLVPVKAFRSAKGRLGGALDDDSRAALARSLATAVVEACAGLAVYVVCEDDDVEAWAASLGATALRAPLPGLNEVVRHGVAELTRRGHDRVLVTHADLSDPSGLPTLLTHDGVVLVPDRRLDGTNALVVPTTGRFAFRYGPGSFARHLSEAERFGLPIHVVRNAGLALDVDEPDDLATHRAGGPAATPADDTSTTDTASWADTEPDPTDPSTEHP